MKRFEIKALVERTLRCKSATIRKDVHDKPVTSEEKLLAAIFGEKQEERYQCKVCHRWHTKRGK